MYVTPTKTMFTLNKPDYLTLLQSIIFVFSSSLMNIRFDKNEIVYYNNIFGFCYKYKVIFFFKELKKNVGLMCVEMHDSLGVACTRFYEEIKRYFYVTPSSYMELIRVYSTMLYKQRTEFEQNK